MVTTAKLWSGQRRHPWEKYWKMSRNCQKQFCENSGKQLKIYSNQISTQSRRSRDKMVTLIKIVTVSPSFAWWQSLSSSSHKVSAIFKGEQSVFPMQNYFPAFRGGITDFIHKLLCVCLFWPVWRLPEGLTQDALLCFTQLWNQTGKAWKLQPI